MSENKEFTSHEERLAARVRSLESGLSYHIKREREKDAKLKAVTRMAVSVNFLPVLSLAGEILYRLDIGSTKEALEETALEHARLYLGTRNETGRLAEVVNILFDGILDKMEKEFPAFGPFELNLFSAMVAYVGNDILTYAMEMGTREKLAAEKTLLTKRIYMRGPARAKKYLCLLDRTDCAYTKKMLSLEDLTAFRNNKYQ